MLRINSLLVEDTYAEAFDGLFARLLITAKRKDLLEKAARAATSLPCTVFNESEGGIERFVQASETPDGRLGAIVQLWVILAPGARENLERELGKRIRQGILVVPTTRVFNALERGEELSLMEKVGHCGDGYEEIVERFGRRMISVPIMMGEFLVEEKVRIARGVMGGNLWFFCEDEDSAITVGETAVRAIRSVEGVITPFDVCSAGSKPVEENPRYSDIGPTTNHYYCPTLRGKVEGCKVPEGVESIPEIVINGVSLEAVKEAMRAGILAVRKCRGLLKVSAGNYGGKLGEHKIYLRDCLGLS